MSLLVFLVKHRCLMDIFHPLLRDECTSLDGNVEILSYEDIDRSLDREFL